MLLSIAQIPRATYYYHAKRQAEPDKYSRAKEEIAAIYHENKGRYGYRRITMELAPGEYYDNWAGVFGNMTIEFYNHLHADKVFMGAHGCSIENGATEPAVEDANTKRAIMAAGKEKFLLADATKFDHTYLMQNAQMGDFDHVITDEGMDAGYRKQLEAVCRDVRYAGIHSKATSEQNPKEKTNKR